MCVGSRCGRWVWSLGRALNDVISGQCVFKVTGYILLINIHENKNCVLYLQTALLHGSIHSPTITTKNTTDTLQAI